MVLLLLWSLLDPRFRPLLLKSFLSLFPVAKVLINLRFNDSEPGGVGNRSWKWVGKVVPRGRRVRDLCDPFVSFCVPSPFAIDL